MAAGNPVAFLSRQIPALHLRVFWSVDAKTHATIGRYGRSFPTMSKAKSKITKRGVALSSGTEPQYDGLDQFLILIEESEKFCEGIGLSKDLIRQIIKTDTDWAFILKIDALLESAARHIIRTGLRIKLLNRVVQNETLDEFIDSLPINGRTSILKLLGQFPARRLALRQAPVPVQRDAIHPYKYFRVIPQLMEPFPSSDPRALGSLRRILPLSPSRQKKSNSDIKSFLIGTAVPFTRHAHLLRY